MILKFSEVYRPRTAGYGPREKFGQGREWMTLGISDKDIILIAGYLRIPSQVTLCHIYLYVIALLLKRPILRNIPIYFTFLLLFTPLECKF